MDSDTIRVRLDTDLILIGFAVILMHEGYMESAILQRQKGSVLPGLDTDTIAKLPIAMPPPEEQGAFSRSLPMRRSSSTPSPPKPSAPSSC